MAKKKNRAIIRPWCWYCEREFEDEKVLMQHQKAKHFKCQSCPRRLNTAGGLAVHIQQVHKLEPENLPRIENALPGRDGYEVEIFGMEGIPAPDVADYKRRKEIELGLNPGTISQPQAKRPKIENRVYSQEELKIQLEAHIALMGAVDNPVAPPTDTATGAVVNAAPQAYVAPPTEISPPLPGITPTIPPFPSVGAQVPPIPGQAPFPPFPGPPGFSPGPLPPGFPQPPPGFAPPGAGAVPPFSGGIPPPGVTGAPPMVPPFIPPSGLGVTPPAFSSPLGVSQSGPPSISPSQSGSISQSLPTPAPSSSLPAPPAPPAPTRLPTKPPIPDPKLKQENPELKKGQILKYTDANYSPVSSETLPQERLTNGLPPIQFRVTNANVKEESRAYNAKYFVPPEQSVPEESRGKKRARAEDFL